MAAFSDLAFDIDAFDESAFDITDASDTTPDPFTFNDRFSQPLSTVIESNIITVTGINATTPISITTTDGMEYRINGGAWTALAGNVELNDTVQLRVTSSNLNSTAVSGTLDIGGVTDTWTVTTTSGVSAGNKRILSNDTNTIGGTFIIWN